MRIVHLSSCNAYPSRKAMASTTAAPLARKCLSPRSFMTRNPASPKPLYPVLQIRYRPRHPSSFGRASLRKLPFPWYFAFSLTNGLGLSFHYDVTSTAFWHTTRPNTTGAYLYFDPALVVFIGLFSICYRNCSSAEWR